MASSKRTTKRKSTQIKRAIAYARYSSNNQREESIDAQLRAIREYAEKNNIEIVAVFTDEAITGQTDKRDDFQKMIRGIVKGHFDIDAVLVHKFNRFARNKYDSAIYKKRLKEINVRVVSVTQKIDDTPEGAMMESFLEAMDEYYSANLALEVRKGLRENALKGKHAGGQVNFGLSLDNEGYYIPNENAQIVKRIFEEYAAGFAKTEICERLNKEGYRNQRGKRFNTRTISDFLRNEKYIGNYIYTIDKVETIRLDGVIKNPIIDRKLWDKVQKLCESGSIKGRYRKQKRIYYLTGKAFCECCGSPISGAGSKRSRNGNLNYYYKCVGKVKHKNGCTNPSINKDWFEPRLLKAVINSVMTEERIKYISKLAFEELEQLRETPVITTASLQKELTTIKDKEERLMELYIEGEMSKEILDKKKKGLVARKFEIEEELERRSQLNGTEDITEDTIFEFVKNYIEYLKEHYSEADDEFMRVVFSTFVDKVIVGKEKITAHLKADFSLMGGGDSRQVSGVIHNLATVNIQTEFDRKTNLRDRNN